MDSISNEVNDIPRTSGTDDEARAIDDYIEAEVEKIGNMTLEEIDAAADEAYEEFYMADKEAREATRNSNKAFEYLHAITKTPEKDSFMGLKWVGSYRTVSEAKKAIEEAIEVCDAALGERHAADRKLDRSRRVLDALCRAREKRPITDCEDGASCSY